MMDQCWCGVDTDVTKHGTQLADSACDMECAGSGQMCGGYVHFLTPYHRLREHYALLRAQHVDRLLNVATLDEL